MEDNNVQSRVGERALGGISPDFAPLFHSEARGVGGTSSALNLVTALPAGANFCKALVPDGRLVVSEIVRPKMCAKLQPPGWTLF